MASFGTAGKKQDLLIKQGCSYSIPFRYTDELGAPKDLTGCTVRSQIRKTIKSPTITETFAPLISPDPSTGLFTLSLTALQTSAIPAGDGPDAAESKYVYDVELVSAGGVVTPLAYGVVRIHPEVTR